MTQGPEIRYGTVRAISRSQSTKCIAHDRGTALLTTRTHTQEAHTSASSSKSRRPQSPKLCSGSKMVARMVLLQMQAAALNNTCTAPPSPAHITAIPAIPDLSVCAGVPYLMSQSSARCILAAGDDRVRTLALQTLSRSNAEMRGLWYGMSRAQGARDTTLRVFCDR